MKITLIRKKSPKVKMFLKESWGKVHKEHFGNEQDESLWKKHYFKFKLENKRSILGYLEGDIMAGVMHVDQLIVKEEERGTGVGKLLLKEAEKYAQKHLIHKIYLFTGRDWKAVKFYEKNGYSKEAIIRRMYEKKDFIILSKEYF